MVLIQHKQKTLIETNKISIFALNIINNNKVL